MCTNNQQYQLGPRYEYIESRNPIARRGSASFEIGVGSSGIQLSWTEKIVFRSTAWKFFSLCTVQSRARKATVSYCYAMKDEQA
eukprot:2349633-Rhodomonas_salina.7